MLDQHYFLTTTQFSSSSGRHPNAAHLSPRPEPRPHLFPVPLGRQQMSAWSEVRRDDAEARLERAGVGASSNFDDESSATS